MKLLTQNIIFPSFSNSLLTQNFNENKILINKQNVSELTHETFKSVDEVYYSNPYSWIEIHTQNVTQNTFKVQYPKTPLWNTKQELTLDRLGRPIAFE